MPVIIKKNIATECCVTNKASAIIYDWDSTELSNEKKVLNTLFVQLVNSPRNIHLEGLHLNVILLPR